MLRISALTFILILLFTSALLSKDLEKISIESSNKTVKFSKDKVNCLENKKQVSIGTHVKKLYDYTLIWELVVLFILILLIGIYFLIKQNKLKREIEVEKNIFQHIFNNTKDSVLILCDGVFTNCNNSTVKMLGYKSKQDVLNLSLSQLSPKYQPDGRLSLDTFNLMIQLAIQNGYKNFKWVHIKADKTEFWCDVMLTSLGMQNNKGIIHLVLRDISLQKQLEDKLLEINKTLEIKVFEQVESITKTQKQFEAIFETVMDGVAIVDLNSNFLLVNNAFAKILERTKKELYKTSCFNITIPSMREESKRIFKTVLVKGKYKGYKKQYIKGSGKIIDVKIDFVLMDSKKTILMVMRDITQVNIDKKEQELQNQQLLQQSRLAQMGEMISMIAHQWRQPLNAISLTTGNLQLKLMIDDVNHDFFKHELDLIEEYSQHLSETIDDFRGFFKEQKEQKNTTLEKIVNNTLNIIRVSVENKNIQIITTLECNKQFKTYENEVIQVVLNIIKNAEDTLLEKNIKNPTIWIESFYNIDTSKLILTIKDNAGGIPMDIINKIFDPYFSTKLEKDGTGLGLHMSKVIIEEHCGGKLSVRNDKDGAVFELMFNNTIEGKK